jgi:predicted alpha-1,6-mannanase (GH76 family)
MVTAPRLCFLLGVSVWLLLAKASTVKASYLSEAEAAAAVLLDDYYDNATGLFDGWWQSANTVTTLADLAYINSSLYDAVDRIFANTFVRAPDTYAGFLNNYYDDEAWWALAWIRAFDVTNKTEYLEAAVDIFDDMVGGWGTPCGGIWWDKNHTQVNAIANELFLSVAANLANRVPDKQSYYLGWARSEWAFFEQSGMINSHNNINDGLSLTTCENNGHTVWSYNQGVVLGGLVELNNVDPNSSYITVAKLIATAAIALLTDTNDILHEPCEPNNCDKTSEMFKGAFMRNLRILQQASFEEEYDVFIRSNADSIWNNDRSNQSVLGMIWSGPPTPADAVTQSAALDALVAAAAVSGPKVTATVQAKSDAFRFGEDYCPWKIVLSCVTSLIAYLYL